MSAPLLPAIPRPPDDPTSLQLNARLGWPVLYASLVVVADGALELERAPGSLRWMVEPSGSFGGLRPPANVAVTEAGNIWLLDGNAVQLKRFDPCSCAFEQVPCLGGEGSQPRQLSSPGGVAVTQDRLYVCDTGNGRLAVFALPSLAMRGHWHPPMAWEPAGVVVDRRGCVQVVDPRNGMVHRFSGRGAYLGHVDGVGASRHLALARDGMTLYAAGPLDAFRITPDGHVEPVGAPADDLTGDFPPLPFVVDAEGRMELGSLCTPPKHLTFDLAGTPFQPVPPPAVPRYEVAGEAILGPLDSLIDACVWHRVVVRGDLPDGARVGVETFTSNVELTPADVVGLPPHAWETRLEADRLDAGTWDGLLRSPGGRFLWLRLRLAGSGRTTPRVESAVIEFPRISLRRHMPAVYGADPVSADFTDRFLGLFDQPLRDIEHQVDDVAALFDPASTPFLDWLASWIGVTLDAQLPDARRRQLLAAEARGSTVRGTREGLWRSLVAYLELDRLRMTCQCDQEPGTCRPPARRCPPHPPPQTTWAPPPLILEHYRLRRWLELGAGRLGDQAVLWSRRVVNRSQLNENAQVGVTQLKGAQDPHRDPFHVYAHSFTVFVPARAGKTPGGRRSLTRLVAQESPAHTHGTITYVEPRFRIGFQSMIGLDSVIARLPQGVTLGQTEVGPASVLNGNTEARIGTAHLSTSARLG